MTRKTETTLDPVESALLTIKTLADQAYCHAMDLSEKQECCGEDYKMQIGIFKKPELEAHKAANMEFARHYALYEAYKIVRAELDYAKEKKNAA